MKRKRHRENENRSSSESSQNPNKRIRPPQQQNLPPITNNNNNNNNGTTEFLKLALERVCALQAELARDTNNEDDEENDNEQVDPETAGFAACAIETFRFLASEGLTADNQLIQRLSEHLLGSTINNLDISKI